MDRKYLILKLIIEKYIDSAKPMSSMNLLEISKLKVSSATIRNEMSKLEKEGYLSQPHTSAGRVPTVKAYKLFVDNFLNDEDVDAKSLLLNFKNAEQKYFLSQVKEKVYDGISVLSTLTENVAFATVPQNHRTIYLGIANLLKQPEFLTDNSLASNVVEVLEQGFFDAISSMDISSEVQIQIGDNNIFPNIHSCSLMCVKYEYIGFDGILGILGPMRMDYKKNKLLIEFTKLYIEGQKLLT